MNLTNKKIAIVHDYFLFFGWWERLILDMARDLKADIITASSNQQAQDDANNSSPEYHLHNFNFISLFKENNFFLWKHPLFRNLKKLYYLYFKTKFLKKYDLVIYSGDAMLASWNTKKDCTNILYCHTPIRFVYDLYNYYYTLKAKQWQKILFAFYAKFTRWYYQKSVNQMDLIIANSDNVQQRIKHYLNKNSVVVYPPNDLNRFYWEKPKDYYLSWARVHEFKNVEIVVKAFTKMPDKKLIVVSSGNRLELCQKIAKNHPNIQILGRISDQKLNKLIAHCIASLYIPTAEDFGMTAVESLAGGKPCIVSNEGQLPFIIKHQKTWFVCPSQTKPANIITAIHYLNRNVAIAMKETCLQDSKKYSRKKFQDGIKKALKSV